MQAPVCAILISAEEHIGRGALLISKSSVVMTKGWVVKDWQRDRVGFFQ
jgi:hypothetical protein